MCEAWCIVCCPFAVRCRFAGGRAVRGLMTRVREDPWLCDPALRRVCPVSVLRRRWLDGVPTRGAWCPHCGGPPTRKVRASGTSGAWPMVRCVLARAPRDPVRGAPGARWGVRSARRAGHHHEAGCSSEAEAPNGHCGPATDDVAKQRDQHEGKSLLSARDRDNRKVHDAPANAPATMPASLLSRAPGPAPRRRPGRRSQAR